MEITKPYPVNKDDETISIAKYAHPEAENECEAVDLFARDIYAGIRGQVSRGEGLNIDEEIEFYGYLVALRIRLLAKHVQECSAFNVVDDMAIEAEQDIKNINRAFPPSERL